MPNIPRFKAGNLQSGKESVVGSCNGHPCGERWEIETPIFARAILAHLPKDACTILDFGCGVGRLAKEVLKQNSKVTVIGVDASEDERRLAREYVNDSRFICVAPEELNQKVDLAYCIYVLQHIPAIELRHAIERMHYYLKPDGKLIYCSSDYRMAINDGGGFTDDRHLGVNIRRELSRLFEETGEMFDLEKEPKLIKDMVTAEGCPEGSIPHPAKVYTRKVFEKPYFMAPDGAPASLENPKPPVSKDGKTRLIIQNRLAPGDILVMTCALRSLHKAYPGKYLTDVESPCMEIFENSPYITKLNGDGQKIDMHYPLISDHKLRGFDHHGAGVSGRHFSDGHRKYLEEVLELEIPRTGLIPDIFLSQDETLWPSPVLKECGHEGKYWVLNAGSKDDYTLKQYHRWQEVVNLLVAQGITLIQIGAKEHRHTALSGTLDMRGKTGHRELYRLIYKADGVLTSVSYPMHVAAAFMKPCVVVAGGRESTRWELYPNHRFLHTNGAIPCAQYDGCWKSKLSGDKDGNNCLTPIQVQDKTVPKCMELIKPSMVAESVMMYYEGGALSLDLPEKVKMNGKKREKVHA